MASLLANTEAAISPLKDTQDMASTPPHQPDRIDPQSPPETPGVPQEPVPSRPPEIDPPTPDIDNPDVSPDEVPPGDNGQIP